MPRIVDHDAQREELLAKAFDLFADKGYASLSMRQLSKKLGVSTGTLYHYFHNKDDIFAKMITWVTERDVIDFKADIMAGVSPQQRLTLALAWVCGNEAYLQKVLLLVFDFQRHRQDEEARELVANAASRYREELLRLIGGGDVAWSLILGMLVHGILERRDINVQDHFSALSRLGEGAD